MKLLAVETSTQACSAALWIDGEVYERFEIAPREHTKIILPMIDHLMSEAELLPNQLDALAFSRGPGSFTGVRIATGVIQGIAYGADLPVVPVSTLAAIAHHFFKHSNEQVAFTAMDARMDEIFWAVYQKNELGFPRLLGNEAVTPAEQIVFPSLKGYGVGSGWEVYQATLSEKIGSYLNGMDANHLPRAGAVAELGAHGTTNGLIVPVEKAIPVYLRDKVAKKESER